MNGKQIARATVAELRARFAEIQETERKLVADGSHLDDVAEDALVEEAEAISDELQERESDRRDASSGLGVHGGPS